MSYHPSIEPSSDIQKHPDYPENLMGRCEAILARHGALDLCAKIEPRRSEAQPADLRLLFADRRWLSSQAGAALIDALQGDPIVEGASRHRSAVLVRFDDAAIAQMGQALIEGEHAWMDVTSILGGTRFTVSFVGANTNKALHVGHLRNIVLGQALASTLACAGACVERHSLVGDIGRRVCEAMGGYITHHDGETPEVTGLAGDRFVELCARDYRGDGDCSEALPEADPNADEREPRGDLADAIMGAWLSEAPLERELWCRMRAWVMNAHNHTLSRLGVLIDRHDFESAEMARADVLLARGLTRGMLRQDAAGAVVYDTGRSEYKTMVLRRSDGVLTEYARLLGLFDLILDDLGGHCTFIEVVGIEWQPAAATMGELLRALRRSAADDRYDFVYHGLLTVGGRKMGSSTGRVTWIADLLDEVRAGPVVSELYELAGGSCGREELADILLRGNVLCTPSLQPLSVDRLTAGRSSCGWTIAAAWCMVRRQSGQRAIGATARTPIIQSQLFRRAVRRAVDRRDPAILASYLLGLSQACLAAPGIGAAILAPLHRVLESLGFVVTQSYK